ncbi:hypothetical protein [Aureimonas ureilytica]|uniref:hypothetical protein n=1 Tax=Aureimonas ureilytica TaxID=401562 RepID=UPI00128FC769|nr:hypothetical protein [Aureimonas ureilytica]
MSDEDRTRRLAAKRNNERVKLASASLNTVAMTTFGAGIILPSINGNAVGFQIVWLLIAVALHLVAQATFRFLRSED